MTNILLASSLRLLQTIKTSAKPMATTLWMPTLPSASPRPFWRSSILGSGRNLSCTLYWVHLMSIWCPMIPMLSFPQISLCISFALVSYLNIRHSLALLACFCPHFFAGDAESDRMRSDRPCRLPSPNAFPEKGNLKEKCAILRHSQQKQTKKENQTFLSMAPPTSGALWSSG